MFNIFCLINFVIIALVSITEARPDCEHIVDNTLVQSSDFESIGLDIWNRLIVQTDPRDNASDWMNLFLNELALVDGGLDLKSKVLKWVFEYLALHYQKYNDQFQSHEWKSLVGEFAVFSSRQNNRVIAIDKDGKVFYGKILSQYIPGTARLQSRVDYSQLVEISSATKEVE